MILIKNENIRPFDIDGTLIVPYSKNLPVARIYDAVTKGTIKVSINESMVRMLREEHHRGGYIVVWSRGGHEWAANVIRALGLEQYVHLVMSKPVVYFDDIPVKKWLKDRVFLKPEDNYRK